MKIEFDNLYIGSSSIIASTEEKKGKLSNYIDKVYDSFAGEDTYFKAQVKMARESIKNILKKNNLKKEEIDAVLGGDLTECLAATSLSLKTSKIPFIGLYSACASFNLAIIIGGLLLNNNKKLKLIVTTSSHNKVSEKEFRNPTEYGAPKKLTSSYTVTGAVSTLLKGTKTPVRVVCATIGRIIDAKTDDNGNMGNAMAPAAVDTLIRHLKDTKKDIKEYDLILTGDLGSYASKVFLDLLKEKYNINIKNKYKDCASMIYEGEKEDLYAGSSGPTTSSMVLLSTIYDLLKTKKLNRVLLLATGALFSKISVDQKEGILGICHAIELESVK